MNIGIVGHGANKFTPKAELEAKQIIKGILEDAMTSGVNPTVVSGHSPVGGIDIWAEEMADELGLEKDIKAPEHFVWNEGYGYKARNTDIARVSDVLYVIVVDTYPPNFPEDEMKFDECYHCEEKTHIKSGGCWTGQLAKNKGKTVRWIIVKNEV